MDNVDPDVLQPVNVRRVIAKHGRASDAPRIAQITLSPINNADIKYVSPPSTHTGITKLCDNPNHAMCFGHLIGKHADENICRVGYPSYMVANSEDTYDPALQINNAMLNDEPYFVNYYVNAYKRLLGKEGVLRSDTLSIRAATSARDVASPEWWINKEGKRVRLKSYEVLIRKDRAKLMKIPYRDELPDGTISPTYKFRPLVTGDLGVLIRAPVILLGSVQYVKFIVDDITCLRCHADMCARLGLDFDGDELHTAVVTGSKARDEIAKLIMVQQGNAFSDELLKEILDNHFDTKIDDLPKPADENGYTTEELINMDIKQMARASAELDRAASTTCSITNLDKVSFANKHHNKWGCSEGPRGITLSHRHDVNNPAHISIVERSIIRMGNLISMNLSVPQVYTIAEGAKLVCCTAYRIGNLLRPKWAHPRYKGLLVNHDFDNDPYNYGYPGVRLITKLTQNLTNSSIKSAKQSVEINTMDTLVSLLCNKPPYFLLTRVKGKDDVVCKFLRSYEDLASLNITIADVIHCTSRQLLYKLTSTMRDDAIDSMHTVVISTLIYILTKNKIPFTLCELYELASIITASVFVNKGETPISDVKRTDFLHHAGAPWMDCILQGSVYEYDKTPIDKYDDSRNTADIDSLLTAISTGNFASILNRSISNISHESIEASTRATNSL